jgi:hypothetical protein
MARWNCSSGDHTGLGKEKSIWPSAAASTMAVVADWSPQEIRRAAPGGGKQFTHPGEDLHASRAWHPLVSQDQQHFGAFAPKLLQPGQPLLRRRA